MHLPSASHIMHPSSVSVAREPPPVLSSSSPRLLPFYLLESTGYGTFVPVTNGGRVALVLFGFIGICASGFLLGVVTRAIDCALERMYSTCCGGSSCGDRHTPHAHAGQQSAPGLVRYSAREQPRGSTAGDSRHNDGHRPHWRRPSRPSSGFIIAHPLVLFKALGTTLLILGYFPMIAWCVPTPNVGFFAPALKHIAHFSRRFCMLRTGWSFGTANIFVFETVIAPIEQPPLRSRTVDPTSLPSVAKLPDWPHLACPSSLNSSQISTIGLGDLALSHETVSEVVTQFLLFVPGLALFTEYAYEDTISQIHSPWSHSATRVSTPPVRIAISPAMNQPCGWAVRPARGGDLLVCMRMQVCMQPYMYCRASFTAQQPCALFSAHQASLDPGMSPLGCRARSLWSKGPQSRPNVSRTRDAYATSR